MEDLSHEVIPAILLVGDINSGKDNVIKALLGGSDSLTLTLDTKYYTARAKIIAAEDIDPGKETEIAWEAVVLVFDTNRKSSFDHVKAWASSHDVDFAEIRACVGCKNGNHISEASAWQTDWQGAAVSWCTGNRFEYLEVAPRCLKLDRELAENGDSQGMQRLRELLEAHMWPGLILKDQNKTDLERNVLSSEPQSKELHSMGAEGVPRDESTLSNKPGSQEHSSDDSQLEEDIESFEAMISGMASARQQISSLPDKQRREEAEALTLRLLSKLGFDEATDSDSDSPS